MPTLTLPQYNPTQGIDTYSKILGLKQQQLELQTQTAQVQTSQATAQKSQAEAWQAGQTQREMQFMASTVPGLLKDPQAYGPDGVLNADFITNHLSPGMPTQWANMAPHIYETQASGIAVKQAALGFNTAERQAVATALSGPAQDPKFNFEKPSQVSDFIGQVKSQLPKDAGPLVDTIIAGVKIPKTNPDGSPIETYTPEQANGIKQHLQILINPLLSPTELAPKGGEQHVGGAINAGAYAPGVGGGGFGTSTSTPMGIPPGANVVTDANGRQFILNPQTNTVVPVGSGHGVGAGGKGVAPATPKVGGGSKPVKGPGITFTQAVPNQQGIQQDIETARKADADYGTNRHINDNLLRLSADTATGPGTEAWHSFLGGALSPVGGNNVSDYQTINAMLDRQAAMATRQMGLPETNAGLQTAASLSGTTSFQPDALQTKVRLTDALVEGSHQYRQGLDKVVGTGPNQDLTKYQDFRSAWAANFEPNVFRAENDIKRGDKKDLAALKAEVGAAGMKALANKSKILEGLSNGKLP